MYFDPVFMAITGVSMLASKFVGSRLQQRFAEYSQMPLELSGKEVAEKMLSDNGITDVQVVSVGGQLTDHYNPATKTVNLSEVVYNQRNVAAAAVSAHEVGHAIQHATAYGFLKMRSNLVPVLNISNKVTPILLMIGIGIAMSGNPWVLLAGIVFFAMTTLFTIVTLPVEYDASNRALKWLESTNVTTGIQHEKAKDALKWAARTYLVAALASVGQLLYYVMIFMRSRDRG